MIAGAVLILIAGTGCILAFEGEIDRLLNRNLMTVSPGTRTLPLADLADQVRKSYPKARVASFALPMKPDQACVATISRGRNVFVDPYTGKVLGDRTPGGSFVTKVRQLHAKLLLGYVGEQIVGYSSLVLVLISITGLILWWPRKLMKFNPKSSWKRINFDLHSATGFFASLFVMILALTGMVITFSTTAIPLIFKVTGDPPPLSVLPPYTALEGARPISADQLLQLAVKTVPEAKTSVVPVPRVDDYPYVDVIKWLPGDDGRGHTTITFNEYTGEVARIQESRHLPPGTAALNLNRALHFGEVYGLPTRILASLVSFTLLLQIFTGFTIWFVRYRNTRKAKARKKAMLAQEPMVMSS